MVAMSSNTGSLSFADVSRALEARLRVSFDKRFQRYVRIVHGPPKRDRIGGKLPAVAVHLFEVHFTEYAKTGRRGAEAGRNRGARLDYMISAWAEDPIDEQRLLDRIRSELDMDRTLVVPRAGGEQHRCSILVRQGLKLDSAISFWNSIGQPVQASLLYAVSVASRRASKGPR